MQGRCGWQCGISLRIKKVHLCLYGPNQNISLGRRAQRTRNENDVTVTKIQKMPKRHYRCLHWVMYYVKMLVFPLWLFMYENVQQINFLVRRWEGNIRYLIAMAPLVAAQHSFHIPHSRFSILYSDPSSRFDHFLPTYFHGLPQPPTVLATYCLCSCRYFQSCFRIYLFRAIHHRCGAGGKAEKGQGRRAGLSFTFHC